MRGRSGAGFVGAWLAAPVWLGLAACTGLIGAPGSDATCPTGAVEFCHPSAALAGKGACLPGTRTCSNGEWGACIGAVMPVAEDCATPVDDDCDGLVDEGCPCEPGAKRDCYTGGAASLGKGSCAAGSVECVDGSWSAACVGEVLPSSTEACDGVDDDCDGSTDEACSCDSGAQVPCYPFPSATEGVGACKAGSQTCDGTSWSECGGAVGPAPEVCNGVDDDCDGTVDEGNLGGGGACQTGASGPCAAGVLVCSGGKLACVGGTGGDETCNGVDDDCDGSVDNGNPGGGGACNTGKPGACAAGTLACAGGALACTANAQPKGEACNGVDDDCDGATDEEDPGGGGACNTGMLGACSAGVRHCHDGALGCDATYGPLPEVCNGVDDDCDGGTDEEIPSVGDGCSTGLLGPCEIGTLACAGGKLVCQQTYFPAPEVCNFFDDDCDGFIDEFDNVFCGFRP